MFGERLSAAHQAQVQTGKRNDHAEKLFFGFGI
jgi:hypothetical protein